MIRELFKVLLGTLAFIASFTASTVYAETPKKILWQDDFGEFVLSDSSGSTYTVWDYSDMNNPVQVIKKTQYPFRYELDTAPLGYKFCGNDAVEYGYYTVAGVLTSNRAYKTYDGAKLMWANSLHGIFYPEDTIPSDHSGKIEGCCLFVNCPDDSYGKVIYSKSFENIPLNKKLFFETYISIFTRAASGIYRPVDVVVKLVEIGNESDPVYLQGTQTLPSLGGTGDWVKLSDTLSLKKTGKLKLEIINNSQYSIDLVLDDIRLLIEDESDNKNFFEGKNVEIEGDSAICAYSLSRYALNGDLPADCSYSWLYDGENIHELDDKRAIMIGNGYPIESNQAGSHTLSCIVTSPDKKDTLVASREIEVSIPEIEVVWANVVDGINYDRIDIFVNAGKNSVINEYEYHVNDLVYKSDFEELYLTSDDIEKARFYVTAKDVYGCISISEKYDIFVKPWHALPSGIFALDVVWREDFGNMFFNAVDVPEDSIIYFTPDFTPDFTPNLVSNRRELENAPAGYEFCAEGPILDGQYAVAAGLKEYRFADCVGCYEPIKIADKNVIIDHSGNMEGNALYINLKSETKGNAFYSRTVTGLNTDNYYELEAFFNTFLSDSMRFELLANIGVMVRVSEVGNPSNYREVKKTFDFSKTDPKKWSKIAVSFALEKGDAVLIELISDFDLTSNDLVINDMSGNLVVDDIRILSDGICVIADVENIEADEADEIVSVYTVSGVAVKTNVKKSDALKGLDRGVYVIGDKKYLIKK